MVDTSRGIKKSNFPVKSVPTGGFFDYTLNGVNYKIALTDMITAFGTTGTIQQDGDAGDTPVLDDQGSVKGIRNISSGQGIIASIDGNNSVEIKSGIQQDPTGTSLFDNLTLNMPTIASLSAGDGIDVTKTGDVITVTATGLFNIANRRVVNELADFPTAVTGVITLAANTEYFVTANISTPDRFVLSEGTYLHGSDSSISGITYTGAGNMFSGSNVSCKISQMSLTCASGALLNMTASSPGAVFQLIDCTVPACSTVGTLGGLTASQIVDVNFSNITAGGVTFTGSQGIFVSTRCLYTIAAGTLYNLGTSTFSAGFSLSQSFVTLNGSSVMLSGLTGSGNMLTGALGSIVDMRISGAGTPLNNISVDDALWQFSLNDDIADTRPDLLLYLSAARTVPVTVSTPVKIGGTGWVEQLASQFSSDNTGRGTFNGGRAETMPLDVSLSIEPASGSNKDINIYLAINGSVITASKQSVNASAGSPVSVSLHWQYEFAPSDYVETWVENITDGVSIVVNSAVQRVN